MAGIELMREFVSRQYNGSWAKKVSRMPDRQVASIYTRMIDEIETEKRKPKKPILRLVEVDGGDQLSLFDNEKSLKIKEEYINGGIDETTCQDHGKGIKNPGSSESNC